MKAAVIIIVIMGVVAWIFAMPLLVLIAINAIVPDAVVINQWSYLAMWFIMAVMAALMRSGSKS
jgi:hypothetical protein